TASPPACRAATVAQTRSRTSRRTSPDSSATMLEPSLSTKVDISRLSLGATPAAQRAPTVSPALAAPPCEDRTAATPADRDRCCVWSQHGGQSTIRETGRRCPAGTGTDGSAEGVGQMRAGGYTDPPGSS